MGQTAENIVKGAVVAAAVATGVGLVVGATTMAAAGTYFATSFAINAAVGAVSTALASSGGAGARGVSSALATGGTTSSLSPKPEARTAIAELTGRSVMTKQPLVSRKIVYGEVKTSGPIVFLETTNKNKNLHVCVALASHEIEAVEEVYLNELVVKEDLADNTEVSAISGTKPDYSSNVKITAHFGATDQAADANLVSRTSFTTDHRLRGIAYIYTQMVFDASKFANGLPNISATVKGRKIYDPRTEATAYSNNAALCIRDYLSDPLFGLGATADEIDDTTFIAAANICDEDVDLAEGGTEKRYTVNGTIDTSKSPADIITDLLTSCAGTLYYSNGMWKLKVGAYSTPTETITIDELRGPIKIQTRYSGQEQYNAVKGVFVSPENNWQPTDYPSLTSSVFEAEDGGETKFIDLGMPYTTSVATAQRLAKQSLYRNREQVILTVPCNLKAFKYDVGDTVYVTNERLGFDQKPFEVVSWSLMPDISADSFVMGVDLTLKETNADIYAWDEDVDEQSFTFNNTNLPNAFDVTPPGVTVSDELRVLNQEAVSVLIVKATSDAAFIDRFEVQAKKTTDTEYINLGQASGSRFELLNVEDGATYDIRSRIVTTIGVFSEYSEEQHQIVGKTAPPQDVNNFTGNVVGGALSLTWTPVSDLDLSHYRLRYSSLTSGATYQNAITLIDRIPRPGNSAVVPARQGTYFLKAVDKLNLASVNPATVLVLTNVAGVENLNLVATVVEGPEFDGVKDDTVELDAENKLILDTAIDFDSATGLFDDATGLFDGGGGNVDLEGFYYFFNDADLGDVYTSRVTASIQSTRQDYVNTFDDATGLFDNREGLFDGDVNAFDNTDVELQVRTTDDDPGGSPTWSSWFPFVVGDYTARAFEFRLRLTTADTQATPVVSGVTVQIDMPDRVLSGEDIASGAAAKAVAFSPAFKAAPAIGISATMQTGDFYEITSKTASGFTITFKDSGGNAVDRTFDYVAKGYGRLES